MKQFARAALKEPLVHFLLAGFLVFLFFAWRGTAVDPASRTIHVSQQQLERLAASWTQTMQRQPTRAEIDGLIRDTIKDEVYAREALRLGLDKDDPIIRRRLRSKMEFLATSQVENAVASDETLQKLLDANPLKYATGSRFSFDQIYFDADDFEAVNLALQKLTSGQDWQTLGAAISLPKSMDRSSRAEIAKIFGEPFADAIGNLKPNKWAGPVQSGFGVHLVRITQIAAGVPAQLKDVRRSIENDWHAATIREREEAAYQALLDGYTIKIAKP